MTCPDPQRLDALSTRTLPRAEEAQVQAHVLGCPRCQERVQNLLRSHIDDGSRTPMTVDEGALPELRARKDMEAASPLARGESVGRYVVLDLLGQGGMGVVYAAYDPELDRKVALKLLQADPGSPGGSLSSVSGQARLLREAQALAKLSHPNVVAVYDAGNFKDRVFVAMELVDGENLRAWQKTPRPVRELLAVYRAAADGLAAAHRAGIVHRDVKPDNILLGKDGRVRVMDFGLARASPSTAAEPRPPLPASPVASSISDTGTPRSPASGEITQDGMVIGTPAYMAPEQLEGQPASERTDQFSFAVALHEALYGARPFKSALLDPRARWELVEPHGRTVPQRVRRILLRALSLDPKQRFASMEELGQQLAREPISPRSLLLGATAVVAIALATGFNLSRGDSLCGGADQALAGVWDREVAGSVERAFLATGHADAQGVFARIEPVLERYANGWARMHRDACLATQVRKEQSAELLELRMGCLENRRQELRALGNLFAHAEPPVVDRAVQSAYSLSLIDDCADLEALRAPSPLPKDPTLRHRIAAARARLAEGKVFISAGQYKRALEVAEATYQASEGIEFAPLAAETRYLEGTARYWLADYTAAERALNEALFTADRARDDALRVRSALVLAHLNNKRAQLDQGRFWVNLARAGLDRIGAEPQLESWVYRASGLMGLDEGSYPQAIADLERSLALAIQAFGEDHPDVAASLNNLATAYDAAGRLTEAVEVHLRALPMRETLLGPSHPMLAQTLNNLSSSLIALGRAEEALPHAQRSARILEAAVGKAHPRLAIALAHVGRAQIALGRHHEALVALGQALVIDEQALGKEHPDVGSIHEYRSLALAGLGKKAEAIAALERGLQIEERFKPDGRPELASRLELLSKLIAAQDPKRSSALHARAVKIAERTLPESSVDRQRIVGVTP